MELTLTQTQEVKEQVQEQEVVATQEPKKKKTSLADFKVKSFMTNINVEQVQFLKTVGG